MHSVEVALFQRSYAIHVGRGLLAEAARHLAGLFSPRRLLIVSDEVVARLYLRPLERALAEAGFGVSSVTVPPGEKSKSLEQLARLYEACFQADLERGSFLVALGGGVVGDLAGFAAATYLRGLPFVQLPTTLLAQVDSSVGGKTGLNLPGGKNLVGAFHQPVLVLADVATLATLDDRQFATGLAEVVKHAMIRDAGLFARLESEAGQVKRRDAATLEEIIAANCRIKAQVVSADEYESDLRAILNYGHTIGHALERVASYGAFTHGEAVALGMVAEAELARQRGYIEATVVARQKALLETFGLPTQLRRQLDADEILAAMRHDKKVRQGRIRIVLPVAIGDVRVVDDASDDELRQAIQVLCHS
jgi:3-dehydroquinate synthase